MASKKPRYEWGGIPIPSVTEILGLLNKPALVPWAVKVTADTFAQIIRGEGTIITEGGAEVYDIAPADLDDFIVAAKKAHRDASRTAMDHGTAVHNAIDAWIQSGGIMSPDEVKEAPVRDGLQAFLAYGDTVDLAIVENEKQVFGWVSEGCKADGACPLFAGRFDLLARINGTLTMCDFKVSNGVWDEYWLQLEAYAKAHEQNGGDTVEQLAVFRIDKTTGVLEAHTQPRNRDRWMAFWHLANAKTNLNKLKGEQ